jgi:orotidine-5'-phosphate decarboxylase
MGTSLPTEYISLLQNKFDNIIVALDRDATSKAFDIARELGYRSKTRVIMLEDDLKYFKPDEIREILCKNDS